MSCLVILIVLPLLSSGQQKSALTVLDNVRIIDGLAGEPIERGRIVLDGDRILRLGAQEKVRQPTEAETVDLAGRTVMPGLIDLHFHIENDPKLALRQLSHGVTSFRDPGQWEEKFQELRTMIAADGLPGPRIFTAGPHIDGERPAYPADAVVARDAAEARRLALRNIEYGATAIKIYFRLPLASAAAVIDVCHAEWVPCTAHLEILDATELFRLGLHGVEHITSLGISLMTRLEAETYRQAVLADNDARRAGRYRAFAGLDLNGRRAQELYSILRSRRPFVDATLAVFERRAPAAGGRRPTKPAAEEARVMVAGFEQMKRLTKRVAVEGARVVMGGHSTVPFAPRGEAPWRELELLVESGFTPLEAIAAGTSTAAAFLYRSDRLGSLRAGSQADLVVLRDNPAVNISAVRTVERVMVAGRWVDIDKYRRY